MAIKRVRDEDLDCDDDLVFYHEGKPFSGVAFEETPDGGMSEVTHHEGMQAGPARRWYPAGSLKEETYYYRNTLHGPHRERAEDGRPTFSAVYEYGICITQTAYNDSGHPLESYRIDENSVEYSLLLKARNELDWPMPSTQQ